MQLASTGSGSEGRPAGRPVSRQVLADHVYEELLASLMDGRLEPGAAVSIDGTARELDVSPTPVREALARLEHTGMVRRVALKGYRVAPVFTREDFAELMEARLAIEPVNARLACARLTPNHLKDLEQAVADLKDAPRGPVLCRIPRLPRSRRAVPPADRGADRQPVHGGRLCRPRRADPALPPVRGSGHYRRRSRDRRTPGRPGCLGLGGPARRPKPPWPSTCARSAAGPSRTPRQTNPHAFSQPSSTRR